MTGTSPESADTERADAEVTVREATADDYDAVAEFTANTWSDREIDDYIPRIYRDWVANDERTHTVVAEVEGEVAGLAQTVMLSEWEAWNQGLRVHPDHRGQGVSVALTEHLFEWASERGATTAGVIVASWNAPSLGQSRSTGYDPETEFRWVTPDPDPDADPTDAASDVEITNDPDAAWRFWTGCETRDSLRGYALDDDETWAVSQLTRDHLRAAADDDGLFVVQRDGTTGFAHRVREYERQNEDGETELWVEYGVAAWEDLESARAVYDAIARDAAELGADRARTLVPETPRAVSDTAACRVGISDHPEFVLAVDLTRRRS